MAHPNILVSSAGRRVRLVEIAQEATRTRDGIVIATDLQPDLSAACHRADRAHAVPPLRADDFLDSLHRIAVEEEVGLIIPTLDTELQLLARVREDWAAEGIHISVSDPDFVRQCRDKWATIDLFAAVGIPSPATIDDDTTFPRFVKPVAGSLSQDIHVVEDAERFDPTWADRGRFIQQELVDSAEYAEFTVDIYYSREGELGAIVPRRRIEVRGGEISKGRTEKGPLLDYLRERMATLPGARGCLTAQFFVARDWQASKRPVLGIEINPRFGGGYPLTDAAGGRYVEWLAAEYLDGVRRPYWDGWTEGLTMLRYDAEVLVR